MRRGARGGVRFSFLSVRPVLSLNLFCMRSAGVAPARGGGHFSLSSKEK
ncbi:hypothetical protein MYA_1920 [Burkholderia sp. KJ006]|nr:hypothetical protein MYA_1920 [Burkholderia sp. KJ006]